jgi:hypothetical protein
MLLLKKYAACVKTSLQTGRVLPQVKNTQHSAKVTQAGFCCSQVSRRNKRIAVSLISTTSHIAQLRMSQHIINAASHAGKRCAHSQANMRYAINRCACSLVAAYSCQTRADFSRFPISFAFFLNRARTKGYHTKC